MPVDVLPEFTPPYVEIQTEALGLSAAEVEQLITVPLEADLLNGVAWLDTIRSESVPGLSSIVLVFEPGTDIMRARQLVQERLTQAHALPNVSRPPAMLQPLSSASRFLMIGLSSQEVSPIEMSVLARWTMRPRLMGVPGVANVAIWGQREQQLQVQVDPKQLQAQGVTLQQVVKTTGNALWVSPLSFVEASTPGTGGFIDTPNQRLGVQHVSPIVAPADLAQVRVEDTDKRKLRLGDVARVVEDHQPLIGDAVVNDGTGLMLVVEKFPNANTLEVTRDVEDALTALKPGLAGVQVDSSVYRPATFLETAMDNLRLAVLVGGLLLLLVLAAFSWRAAVVGLVGIPLSLAAAGLVLHLRGAPMNAMVLAGLVVALGLIVDDVVNDVDSMLRRVRGARAAGSAVPTADIVREAAAEVRRPLFYGVLISLLAAVPIFFTQGASGALLPPLAVTYVLAVLTSTAVALTVTPALAMLLLSRSRASRGESPLARWLHRRHGALLPRVLHTPLAVVGAAVVVTALGLAALPALGTSLLPQVQERTVMLQWDGTAGTSRPEMSRITAQATRELRTLPGVANVQAHVGRAVMSDEVSGINAGQVWVTLDPEADYDATLAAVQETADGYPGLEREVQTYSTQRMREVLTGAEEPLAVRLYGPDLAVLQDKAEEVRRALAQVEGVASPEVDLEEEEPQVEVQVDLARAQRHGIKPGDVRRAAATLLSGLEVGSLFEEQKVFEVVVQGVPEIGRSLTNVEDMLIDRPGGGQVRLGDVAAVRVAPTSTVLEREAVSPRVDVTAEVEGRALSDVRADVERRLQSVAFPLEYRAEMVGDAGERRDGRQLALTVAGAAAIGIFLLLQAAVGSWALAGLIFLALPLALTGGVLAVLVTGAEVTLGSLAGFLAVLGIAARQAVLLVSRFAHLRQHEGEPFGPELVARGTRERLVPIVTSALATGAALLPFAILGSRAGFEIVHPLAVVVLGGLITATLLNLVVVPALYLLAGSRSGTGDLDGPPALPTPEPALTGR